ncbi:ABC transporter ATP-binding protein [Roseimaritima sediminicola]|uniref:ABC transporter ATP-binding protein n=1 Tax=Roseimaritima sediminicola TaxID=2662066 RepID=UPI001F15CD9C|nr:ABC transporter ATP-binding protein [Roseimaritima sediminicola]
MTLSGLTKSYAQTLAIDAVDLEIREGELLVIVGPSGCGKSTALRLIAGLEKPDRGQIHFGERCVDTVPARHRDVAMVFQDYALYPHMSVRDNLGFGLRMRGERREQVRRRVAEVAEALGLDSLLDRKPAELSGGEQQRVAVGRAIVRQPAVFLLDEPLSNLDAQLREGLRVELVRLHRRLQTTMIHVTHDQTEAMMMGQRVAVMRGGRIEQVGPPLELFQRPANRFVAGFLGTPPMNFLSAQIDGEACQSDGFRWPLRTPGTSDGPVEVGVRPSAFRLVASPKESAASESAASETLRLDVEVVQPLGARVLLQCRGPGGQPLGVECPAAGAPAAGDTLTAEVDPRQVHVFDPATGRRLETVRDGDEI